MANTGPNDFIWLLWVFYVKKNFFLKFHHFFIIFHRFFTPFTTACVRFDGFLTVFETYENFRNPINTLITHPHYTDFRDFYKIWHIQTFAHFCFTISGFEIYSQGYCHDILYCHNTPVNADSYFWLSIYFVIRFYWIFWEFYFWLSIYFWITKYVYVWNYKICEK